MTKQYAKAELTTVSVAVAATNLLNFANRHFSWKIDFVVCLFVNDCFIVTIMCGRQIVLLFWTRDCCCSRDM